MLSEILDAIGAAEDDPRLSFHQPLYTAQDAVALEQGSGSRFANVKCTVWTDSAGAVVVTTVPAEARVDTSRVRAVLGVGKLRLAEEEILVSQLSIPRGAVAPFGYQSTIMCVVDSTLALAEGVLISPGANNATLAIDRDTLAGALNAFGCHVAPIAKS